MDMSGLGEVLRAAGMWVDIAPADVRCLEQVHSCSPDVVLVEFGEPDTTALVRDLLETSKRPGILYVVDALAGLADVDRLCLADDHVRLDYGPAELVLRLEVLVARRKSSTCGARFQAGRVRIDRDARELRARVEHRPGDRGQEVPAPLAHHRPGVFRGDDALASRPRAPGGRPSR